ncbi:uncharacterized protein LOC113334038 [Papaver somniferum]|uniref:uncharacterized protein LOC113334038 n=1 Tax=Papaver somniferum TaxID=3469 RepID=UPI000E6FD356|nr:uncharacterized protein LOC113334038 [Papaver somniferum]
MVVRNPEPPNDRRCTKQRNEETDPEYVAEYVTGNSDYYDDDPRGAGRTTLWDKNFLAMEALCNELMEEIKQLKARRGEGRLDEDVDEDMEDPNDPLVLTLPVSGWNIKKIMIDDGSSVNVLFYDTFKRMKLNDEQLLTSYYTIFGFNGAVPKPLGDIILEVKVCPMNVHTRLSVVDAPSPYNTIIGRRWMHRLKGVASTYHQYFRFPTPYGEMEIKADQEICPASTRTLCNMNSAYNQAAPPFRQRLRKVEPEYHQDVERELKKLKDAGFIKEVKYPTWISNMVIVPKKNGRVRICIDFTNLNKTCPKDIYPLPSIDQLVDDVEGHEELSFMDGYAGYNQIALAEEDQQYTTFFTPHGLYCYARMPFGLRNAGATYQRRVDAIFKPWIGRTLEAYVNDMLVKSKL